MGLYYIQTNLVCLLILFVIMYTLRRTSILPARRRAFTRLVISCMVLCFSDIFAWYFNGQGGAGAKLVVHLSNMVYFAAVTLGSYAWLRYVDLRIKSLEENLQRRHWDAIPLAIMLLLILLNPLTHFLFTVDAAGVYSRQAGVVVHWVISWGYLLYVSAKILRRRVAAKSRTEKKQLMPMFWFVIPPAIAAVMQMIFYGLTSTQCGMTLSILIITFSFLSDEVSRDALTGLNNRRALENHLMERLQRGTVRLTVLMCDIDHFKSINDTMGHTAGDVVLKRVAAALKQVGARFEAYTFLCRYGGDEFVVCGYELSEEELRRLISAVEAAVEKVNRDYADNLAFGISIGSATGDCDGYRDVEGLIDMADAAMYQQKNRKKAIG